MIDTEDLQKLIDIDLSWYAVYTPHNDSYYAQASIYIGRENGKSIYEFYNLHTLLMDADASKGEIVDHIDAKNTLDNRKSNLRKTDNLHNTKNRKGKNKNNKSGYRNVFWNTREERWFVTLQIDGKQKCFGRFKKDEVDKAGVLAEEMRQKYYGKFAGVN